MITIYGFLEGPAPTGGWEVTATCQCGTRLLRYISVKAEDAQHDIGVTSQEQHELYRTHCSERHQREPFNVRWIDDSSNYQGVRQSDVEVVDWSKDDLASLANQFKKTFPADRENPPTPPEDNH